MPVVPVRVDLPISIRAQSSLADPDTCKFTVSRSVHPGGPFFFDNRQRAAGSPLGERLFALGGVANVLIAESVVTVGKESGAAWPELKPAIGAAIREQLLCGVPAMLAGRVHASLQARTDAELYAAVQKLLDGQVNRSIADHGGKISIVNVLRAKLFITMSGGCQGCASSQVTLRQGFEVMVRTVAPEIVEIVDATDHAAGKSPFYQRPGQCRGADLERAVPPAGVVVNWGPAQAAFDTVALDLSDQLLAAAIASSVLLLDEARKLAARSYGFLGSKT